MSESIRAKSVSSDEPARQSRDSRKTTYDLNKLRKRLRRQVGSAIADYNMIESGDRVMVCLSGGKDSYTMLDILVHLQRSAPIDFELIAVNLDQKQPGFPEDVLPTYLEALSMSLTTSSSEIPTASSNRSFPRVRQLAACAVDSVGEACTVLLKKSEPIRSRSVITVTIL